LINYLDADNSGGIDFQEFSKKVTLYDLSSKMNMFTISKSKFVEMMLEEWRLIKSKQMIRISGRAKNFEFK
jgi:hypothetical protein